MGLPWRERIKPMDSAEMEPERAARRCVFDTKWYDCCTCIERRSNLIENLARGICGRCEDHHDHTGRSDCINHSVVPGHSRFNVARRNPASNAGSLQL